MSVFPRGRLKQQTEDKYELRGIPQRFQDRVILLQLTIVGHFQQPRLVQALWVLCRAHKTTVRDSDRGSEMLLSPHLMHYEIDTVNTLTPRPELLMRPEVAANGFFE